MHTPQKISLIDAKEAMKWADFIKEEANEYAEAATARDPIGMLDALCDIMVFLLHATCASGMHVCIERGFAEVMASNRTKWDDIPNFDTVGKLVKGPNYRPPDLLIPLCIAAGITPVGVSRDHLHRLLMAAVGVSVDADGSVTYTTGEAKRLFSANV